MVVHRGIAPISEQHAPQLTVPFHTLKVSGTWDQEIYLRKP